VRSSVGTGVLPRATGVVEPDPRPRSCPRKLEGVDRRTLQETLNQAFAKPRESMSVEDGTAS
jgi:hypothetical protein